MRLLPVFVLFASAVLVASDAVSPQQAIEAAVRERVGALQSISVDAITTKVQDEVGLVAKPDPEARLEQLARFELSVRGVRRGLAVAKVTVHAVYPRASRNIARDEVIDAKAFSTSAHELTGVPLRALL